MIKAVQLQMTMVSMNTPKAWNRPALAGWLTLAAAAAQGAGDIVHADGHGDGACRFAKYLPAPGAKSRVNQPGDGGFAPDAVDVDHVLELLSAAEGAALLQSKIRQDHPQQTSYNPGHGPPSPASMQRSYSGESASFFS